MNPGSQAEPAGDVTADGDITKAFATSEPVYVGVLTRRGPHVTPQVASLAGGRLWFVTNEGSVKVRAVRNNPAVSLAAWAAGSDVAVLVHGEARVLDVADPAGLTEDVAETVLGTLGLATYALSNVKECVRTLWQAATGQLTGAADRRVLVGVHPAEFRRVPVAPGADAVLGWDTRTGPILLPGAWDEGSSRLRLSGAARSLLETASASMAAVAADRSGGTGAADRVGVLYRGRGRVVDDGVHLNVERITRWSGGKVETVDATGPPSRD